MDALEAETIFALEDDIQPGAPVDAAWTSCGGTYRAPATVVRRNAKSICVSLDESIVRDGDVIYKQGRVITVPRLMSSGWSTNNRIEPRGGYT